MVLLCLNNSRKVALVISRTLLAGIQGRSAFCLGEEGHVGSGLEMQPVAGVTVGAPGCSYRWGNWHIVKCY